ncbi:MAG: virulence protein SciE type [Chromatiaceae bacterium]|nr:MAG: virulence protein SciE type [Chromatiaceae bacterium]
MTAEEALKAGDPDAALADLTARVRRAPADPRLRVFLFQLLAVLGQWERALAQLNVAGELDAGSLGMVNTYRDALRCEALREAVFTGAREPLLMGEPADWMAWLLQALKLDAQGAPEQAQGLRERALEAAPATPGRIDGTDFAWIGDADTRLGPMLEAIIQGRYFWVPFHLIRALQLEAPSDLRDLVWAPAYLTWANGGETVALLPARYPGTTASSDGRLRLARLTDWVERDAGLFTGLGQRLLVTDVDEYPLLGIRALELTVPAAEAAAAATSGEAADTDNPIDP